MASPTFAPGHDLVGRYRIVELLGVGHVAEVPAQRIVDTQGNRVKNHAAMRLARNSSSQAAIFRLSRKLSFPGALRIRLSAMCLIVVKFAGA